MKAVLISLKPQWANLVFTGRKTVEIRKSKPVLETPFVCYVYQSGSGFVIGEFVCKYIDSYVKVGSAFTKPHYMRRDGDRVLPIDFTTMQLTEQEIENYGRGAYLYGWQIARPERYKTPVALECFGLKRAPQSWRYVLSRRSGTE